MTLPLTLISGYLGAGKTTFINGLLGSANREHARIVVLVNDFGDVAIDAALISSITTDMISLINGCACCLVNDDLERQLSNLVEAGQYDQVVFEASGVADSAKLLRQLRHFPGLTVSTHLTLVDLSVIRRQVRDKFIGEHIQRQLMFARDIVETKADLLDERQQALVRQWLVLGYPAVELHTMAAISTGVVLGKLTGELTGELTNELKAVTEDSSTAKATHPDFKSYRFRGSQRQTKDHLMAWLDKLPPNVQRVKGFVWLLDDPRPHLLNYTPGCASISAYDGVLPAILEDSVLANSDLVAIAVHNGGQDKQLQQPF